MLLWFEFVQFLSMTVQLSLMNFEIQLSDPGPIDMQYSILSASLSMQLSVMYSFTMKDAYFCEAKGSVVLSDFMARETAWY